jgi:uncharacterized membrane protein YgcG
MIKRNRTVTLTLIATMVASGLTACDEQRYNCYEDDDGESHCEAIPTIKHCVDQDGVVQDERYCSDKDWTDEQHIVHHPVTTFFWFYGGYYQPQQVGTRINFNVSGGSRTPISGRSYSSPVEISRGGFGGAGRSFGAGG